MPLTDSITALSQNPFLWFALLAWTLYWKGVALWSASHRNERGWFVAILILNTLGLLELFYLFIWRKRAKKN